MSSLTESPAAPSSISSQRGLLAGVALSSFSALLLELGLTRLFSVVLFFFALFLLALFFSALFLAMRCYLSALRPAKGLADRKPAEKADRALLRTADACDRAFDMGAHAPLGGSRVARRDRLDDRAVLCESGAHVGAIGRQPMQRDMHLILQCCQNLRQATIAGCIGDNAMESRVGAEIAGRIGCFHHRLLFAQDPMQRLDLFIGDPLRRKARRAGLEKNADFVNREQIARIDRGDHDAALLLGRSDR